MGTHVVFGAGALGRSVAEQLAEQGHQVRLISRSAKQEGLPAGVEARRGDALDAAQASAVCADADVVYNCMNLPYFAKVWEEQWPIVQANMVEGAASAGAKYVSAENVYMYGKVDRPMTEDLPHRPVARKGAARAKVAQQLMQAHQSGKVQAVQVRASDFYGPGGVNSTFGETFFPPALAGKPALLFGDVNQPHTYTYVPDFAKALVTIALDDSAYGQVWHAPSAPAMTTRQVAEIAFRLIGRPYKVNVMGRGMANLLGVFVPILRELAEMAYEFEEPFIIDHSKYAARYGDHSTPIEEGMRATVNWYVANQPQK